MTKKLQTLDELMAEEDARRIAAMNTPEALKAEAEMAARTKAKRAIEEARLAEQIKQDHAAGLCDQDGVYFEDEEDDVEEDETDAESNQ